MIKTILTILIALCLVACNKNAVQPVSGTIGGLPALTLYGSSKAPSDYMFLSTSQKKISYNGVIFSYTYATGTTIFLLTSGTGAGKCTLDTLATKTTLTIDTTYGYTFGSTVYTAM